MVLDLIIWGTHRGATCSCCQCHCTYVLTDSGIHTCVSCSLFTMTLQNIVQSDIHRDMKFYTFSKPEVLATLTHTKKNSLVTEIQGGAFLFCFYQNVMSPLA